MHSQIMSDFEDYTDAIGQVEDNSDVGSEPEETDTLSAGLPAFPTLYAISANLPLQTVSKASFVENSAD